MNARETAQAQAMPIAAQPFDTATQLTAVLQQATVNCKEVRGAALATGDGLLLCAIGSLDAESAAAVSSHLLTEISQDLVRLKGGQASEILIWTDQGPWYLTRVGTLPHVVMLSAEPMVLPALLRQAGKTAARRLEPMLRLVFHI